MLFPDNLDDIQECLLNDGVILYPTDTIWGLGSSIYSEKATDKIYNIKNRDRSKPLLLLVSGISMLKKFVQDIHPRVETLLVYHHKPLTLIYEHPINIPEYILSEEGSIGIRVCMDPFCQNIIDKLGHPITSTSANIAGEKSPEIFDEISHKVIDQCDYVCLHRRKDENRSEPSVIAKYNEKGNLNFLRT